jgi:hypothetical protein
VPARHDEMLPTVQWVEVGLAGGDDRAAGGVPSVAGGVEQLAGWSIMRVSETARPSSTA